MACTNVSSWNLYLVFNLVTDGTKTDRSFIKGMSIDVMNSTQTHIDLVANLMI